MFRGFFCFATATNGSDGLALGSESSVESESGSEEEDETETHAPESEDAIVIHVYVRHLMSYEGTQSDVTHPRPGLFGGSSQFYYVDPSDGRPAPRIPQTSSFHMTRPFDS